MKLGIRNLILINLLKLEVNIIRRLKFENKCTIECFQGTTDDLISHLDKRNFCREIKNYNYHGISQEQVDGVIFKSTHNGLDADFLKFFRSFKLCDSINFQSVFITTEKHKL